MYLDKEKKFINRMKRLGKYQIVLLKANFPMSCQDFVFSATERGKYLEWIADKIVKLTKDFTIHRGHEGSNRYFRIYYEFITKMIIGYGKKFKKGLERDKILDEKISGEKSNLFL